MAKTIENNKPIYQIISGGLSGALTRAFCQPFDVLKIRFQLQVEKISYQTKISKYKSSVHGISTIFKEEGLFALWKGHNSAQLLSIAFGISKFYVYETLVAQANTQEFFINHSSLKNFCCGGVAGLCTAVVISPFDVIRTRLIAQDVSNKCYKSSTEAFLKIYKIEGVRGLYRGLLPSMIQTGPLCGANFMFYKMFCGMFEQLFNLKENEQLPAWTLLIVGGFSGMCTKLMVYPFDLTKKRLQIQGSFDRHHQTFGLHFKCQGLMSCLIKTVQFEGALGLYKGLWPSLIKAGFTTSLHFAFYDKILWTILKMNEKYD